MLRAQPARLLATDKTAPAPRLVLLRQSDSTIGSADGSALQLSAQAVDARHALIRFARGRYYLIGFKGGRGSRVNGRAVRSRYRLRHGDQISFGGAPPYRFIDPDSAKRLRNRRAVRAAAVAAAITAAIGAHAFGWDRGALSSASIAEYLGWILPSRERPAPKTAAARLARVSTGPDRAATRSPSNPSAAPSPSPPPFAADRWLKELNHYRVMARLSALREDRKLSASIAGHARYLMTNYAGEIRSGDLLGNAGHEEDPSKPGFSADGRSAAHNSQLAWGCGPCDFKPQITQWIAGPFNRFAMLNPAIAEAGFGEVCDSGCWVAGLRLPPAPEEVKPYSQPVEFPPDGATVSLEWTGMEWPDPLAGCPGYTAPVGLPITLQLGRLVDSALSAHLLTRNGQAIESCAFDAHGYNNSDANAQEYARWALRSSGAVILIPRAPLDPGAQYSVSITAHQQQYQWSFRFSE